jgi:hypothetical protein
MTLATCELKRSYAIPAAGACLWRPDASRYQQRHDLAVASVTGVEQTTAAIRCQGRRVHCVGSTVVESCPAAWNVTREGCAHKCLEQFICADIAAIRIITEADLRQTHRLQ